MPPEAKIDLVDELIAQFVEVLDVPFAPSDELRVAASKALGACKKADRFGSAARKAHLLALVNSKLNLNREGFQRFLNKAAEERVFFNYHAKDELRTLFNYSDQEGFRSWAKENKISTSLRSWFEPISEEGTLSGLHELLRTGKVNRSDARDCPIEERRLDILSSLFGSFVFHSAKPKAMHAYLNSDCKEAYHDNFYDHLLDFYPNSLQRKCSLIYLTIDQRLVDEHPGERLYDAIASFLKESYERLANHCFLGIRIKPITRGSENLQWRIYSDIILYAEKHLEVGLKAGYFKSDKIAEAARSHIDGLDTNEASFDVANEGFFYKDCFVLNGKSAEDSSFREHDLLLLFDKNERDERPIPCPACRTLDVAGNSYPTLGVRSWECQNKICPDRSAYNRGNRYSLAAIIKQEAIKSDADQIPESSLRRWKLDVVPGATDEEVGEMLIRHFTLHGDQVVFINEPGTESELFGRRVLRERFAPAVQTGLHRSFQDSAFFQRFVKERQPKIRAFAKWRHRTDDAVLFNGDCFDVLFSFSPDSIDGAATSPPYYNARSYSTWPNIYCYLFDMYNSARAVFYALKPGSVYLFNIFDYFDNENIVALSAMGKKRMILGAYIINLFRRVGFEIQGNVIWDKGEIEGKRNFNQGNRSPYYQYPFNCWEHTLIFWKPGDRSELDFPAILRAKPVVKMVRGQNVLGHTAPYPPDVPALLVKQMRRGEVVLDPYSGSMTTGRLAHKLGLKSISIELHEEYCALGVRLLEEANYEITDLFDATG